MASHMKITDALSLLTQTFTGQEITPPSNDCPFIFNINRKKYKYWIQEEELKYFTKFSTIATWKKEYLLHGAILRGRKNMGARKTVGRPAYIFRECLKCHCHGSNDGSQTINCNCDAKIEALVRADAPNLDEITVKYYWKHTGHSPGSIEDMIRGRLNHHVSKYINALLDQNMTWPDIKNMLRLDQSSLQELLNGGVSLKKVPLSLAVNYKLVYDLMKKKNRERFIKKQYLEETLEQLGQDIENEKGLCLFLTLDHHETGLLCFAFMSNWQKELLKGQGKDKITSMDSTHTRCYDDDNKQCYLYSIFFRCEETGRGIPLGWMITNSMSHHSLKYWLLWLKHDHEFIPRGFMIDNSDNKIAVINEVFNNTQTDEHSSKVSISLCSSHISHEWKTEIQKKLKSKGGDETTYINDLRYHAYQLLHEMKNASEPTLFYHIFKEFKEWVIMVEEQGIDTHGLLDYFISNYYDKRMYWSLAWRRNHENIHTNNYVESWHRNLKENYIANLDFQNPDELVNILWNLVLPDYMQDYLKTIVGLRTRRNNLAESRLKSKVDAIPVEERAKLIVEKLSNLIKVKDFKNEPVFDIDIDIVSYEMTTCSCDDYTQSEVACSHMYLVNSLFNSIGLPLNRNTASENIEMQERLEQAESEIDGEDVSSVYTKFKNEVAKLHNTHAEGNSKRYSQISKPKLREAITYLNNVATIMKECRDNSDGSVKKQRRF